MKWNMNEPKKGDIVRVLINNSYYHFGIYIGDDKIIQYGRANDAFSVKQDAVKVLITDVHEFIGNKFLEVAKLSLNEKLSRNNPEKTIELATARLEEAKYDLIYNNCEHFVYDCVFNKHISPQIDQARENVNQLLNKKRPSSN